MHKPRSVKTNKLFSPLLVAPVIILIILSANYAFGADDKAMIDSPLKQMQNGISAEDVICKAGMKLILKATDGSPACVTILTKDILVQRGWAQSEGYGAILLTVPNAPLELVATPGSGQVTLSWTAPNNGGSPIIAYVVSFKKSTDSIFSQFPTSFSTSTTVAVTGLTNGISYDFEVAAANLLGPGPYSSIVIATPAG